MVCISLANSTGNSNQAVGLLLTQSIHVGYTSVATAVTLTYALGQTVYNIVEFLAWPTKQKTANEAMWPNRSTVCTPSLNTNITDICRPIGRVNSNPFIQWKQGDVDE